MVLSHFGGRADGDISHRIQRCVARRVVRTLHRVSTPSRPCKAYQEAFSHLMVELVVNIFLVQTSDRSEGDVHIQPYPVVVEALLAEALSLHRGSGSVGV